MVKGTITDCLFNLIGFRQHYNTDAEVTAPLAVDSDSGEYYQDLHPALQLNIIKQSLERDRDLTEYLEEKIKGSIISLCNDLTSNKIAQGTKDLLFNDAVLNKLGWYNNKIISESRFVGFVVEVKNGIGLQITLEDLGLQVNGAQTVDIYVYKSSEENAVKLITKTIATNAGWNWGVTEKITLEADGVYYIGYYQDDLTVNAINYPDFDWRVGHCYTCDGGKMSKLWNNVKRYVSFMPFYVPNQNLDPDRKLFDVEAIMYDYSKNWGLNLKFNVQCDYTYFYCANKLHLKNALGLKVQQTILQDIKYSQQYNYINEDVKALIIGDLEGYKDTKQPTLETRYKIELNNVYLNTGNLAIDCLPCTDKGGVTYQQA